MDYFRASNLFWRTPQGCGTYLGKEENWLEMTIDGNTILRVIHYPPLSPSTPEGAVVQHEDINLITLLVGATADGLQVQDHDGSGLRLKEIMNISS